MPLWSCFRGPQDFDAPGQSPDLAPYKVVRPIGRGAVGEVFLARHSGDGQLYAVKTVPLNAPSWRVELLKREERTYAALATDAGAHVGLLRPCRMQLMHDRLCLVTEWASGGTLATHLSAPRFKRGVPEPLAAFMFRQLVAAVERLHRHRVAYRDIKLDNILLDVETFGSRTPRLLLADFGTCKAWEEGEAGCLTNTFMGTPGFMAPQVLGSIFLRRDSSASVATTGPTSALEDSAEMCCPPSPTSSAHSCGARTCASAPAAVSSAAAGRGGCYDAVKADIYSLGAILMFMLFKELPFGFDKFSRLLPPGEALSVLWQLESEQSWREAAGAQLLRRKCSEGALDLLDKMLHPNEDERIDIAGIKAHPWFRQKLPGSYQKALDRLAREQAKLDVVRASLVDRSTRRSLCSATPGSPAALGAARPSAPSAKPMSGVEAALEAMFDASSDPASLRRLREQRLSLYVDLSPDGVAEAWELGLQTESAWTGRAPRCGGAGQLVGGCGCVREQLADANVGSASLQGAPGGGKGPAPVAGSLAGRSDSATTTGGGGGAGAAAAKGASGGAAWHAAAAAS